MMNIENKKDFKEEVKKLEKTIDTMQTEIISYQERVSNVREKIKKFNPATDNVGLLFVMQEEEYICQNRIRDYQKNKGNPYFASIDVDFDDGKVKNNRYYIGKCSVSGPNNELEVIDWRTPIASIYYDGRLGSVSYDAPEGTIDCELINKRMYTIDNGVLQEYSDVDVTANDELLKPYLNASSDNRLKNIISTIQSEQNKVIRTNIKKDLIVQGVAGAGKTTAALHRIAYLVYENEKMLKPKDFMIIAPNNLFLDYISEVLPDLGVHNVKQLTFEDFARSYLGVSFSLKNSNSILLELVETSKETQKMNNVNMLISNLKGSLDYKDAIERFFKEINDNYLPDTDLKIGDMVIMDKNKLLSIFNQESVFKTISLDEKFKMFLSRLTSEIEANYEKIEQSIIAKRNHKIEALKNRNLSEDEFYNEKLKIYDEYEYRELLKNKGKKLISQYVKLRKKKSIIQYYNLFVDNLEKYLSGYDLNLIESLKKQSKENKKMLDIEDLPAIMYMKKRINGKVDENMAKHVIIDEAQDYSPFQFFVLKEILYNGTMTILGDITQGIYSYRGTNDWNYINNNVFDSKAEIVVLDKSYRTTVEIMNLGNNVIENLNSDVKFTKAVPVIRNGQPVRFKKSNSFEETIIDINKTINEIVDKRKNIAIITKSFAEAKKVYNKLSAITDLNIQIISENVKDYKGGIVIIPSYLSKGLEFDSVIITNANNEMYLNNEVDAKLLYISMTRAMHTLNIFYTGEITELISCK